MEKGGEKMKRTLALVIIGILCLSTFGLLVPKAKADPSPKVYIVKPNGCDDTADIQAAFNAAVAHGPGCTVQLEKGTYYTAQITVFGFQGSFVGMGQGLTIIQALPNLPSPAPEYNATNPFWSQLPGPENPWPMLFTFWNGSFTISGMTLTDPYTNAVPAGFYLYYTNYLPGPPTPYTCLLAAIEITGLQTFAKIDHVTVLGAPGDAEGTNMFNAIMYEGSMLPKGWTDGNADVIPLSGTFSLTNSVFNSMSGILVDTVISARVSICDNTIINSPFGPCLYDVSNSTLLFCGNQGLNISSYIGFQCYQSLFKPSQYLLPSTVYITDNFFQVNRGANAVVLMDFGTVSTLNAVVSGNVFQTDTSYGDYYPTWGYSVIVSYSLKSIVVSGNTILGGGAAGVYVSGGPGVVSGNTITGSNTGVQVDSANGVLVAGNVIKNSAQWGIALTDGSSNNLVAGNLVKNSGQFDLYWDMTGTGNVWIGNQYQTSSPTKLG
jgi:parallel beta-helix repeat protein